MEGKESPLAVAAEGAQGTDDYRDASLTPSTPVYPLPSQNPPSGGISKISDEEFFRLMADAIKAVADFEKHADAAARAGEEAFRWQGVVEVRDEPR